MNINLLTFILIISIIAFTSPANAHRPYLVKDKTFETPEGTIITERLYGDGIFTTDPVSYQVRDSKGNVLAYTATAESVASFCPIISFCWVFPYDNLTVLSVGRKLDNNNLDFNRGIPDINYEGEEKEEFEKYLSDPDHERAHSYLFQYPEFREDTEETGFIKKNVSIFFSPFVIILDNVFGFCVLFLASVVPIFISLFFFKILKSKSQTITIIRKIISTLVMVGYILFYCVLSFLLAFWFGVPLLYLLTALALSLFIASRIERKLKAKNKATKLETN